MNKNMLMFKKTGNEVKGVIKILVWDNKLVLLLDDSLYGERNIKCYSIQGELIWSIEQPIRVYKQYPTFFVGITFQDDKLLAYSENGFEYDVSIEKGSFNKYVLVK